MIDWITHFVVFGDAIMTALSIYFIATIDERDSKIGFGIMAALYLASIGLILWG